MGEVVDCDFIEELRLEEFTEADIDRLISWVPDAKALLQWAGPRYRWPLTKEQIIEELINSNTEHADHHILKFLSNSEVIGHIELNLRREEESAHIGRVLIAPQHRGKKLGNKIIELIKDYAIRKHSISKLTLAVFDFNHSAMASYWHNGFVVTEIKIGAREIAGEKWNLVLMAGIAEEMQKN